MRKSLVLFMLLVTVTSAAFAGGLLQVEGVSDGSTVLRFQGIDVRASFAGTQEMCGTLILDDVRYPFVAVGSAYGLGAGNSETLEVDLWVLFYVEGTVDDVDPITIRGGMDVSGEGIDLDSFSLGSGAGTFFVIAEFGDVVYEFSGSVESTGSGALVPPKDPSTMEVAGTVASVFEGTLYELEGEMPDRLPWEASTWPAELHEQLLALLLTGALPEIEEETEPAEKVRPARGREPAP